ncbi:MAG: deiodinase family protein [Planctomycetota bacterium]|nr:EF-hand domain-containing protein [Planctomycetaceae bacterium]MDQ3329937.1 deiodinase family protein [Planctomycetota bacterium]
MRNSLQSLTCLAALAAASGFPLSVAADPEPSADKAPADRRAELSYEGRRLADDLGKSLPEGSEARAMYDDILSGSRLSATDGWFRLAVAKTRFDWPTVSERFDANGDGGIDRAEFGRSKDDFDRLDRDGDGVIRESDFAWSQPAQDRDEAMALYRPADRDGDGRITEEEFASLFQKLDRDGAGFVTLDDLRAYFARTEAGGGRGGRGPAPDILLRGLARQEIGSLQAGPELGESVPDFSLETLTGDERITLSEQIGEQPVVLVFGNFTCGPFRSQAGNVEKLFRRYGDRAKFLMVYVREAHPTDGWHMAGNSAGGVEIAQPKTYQERVGVATQCQGRLDFGMPFLVDSIDDKVGAAYSGMPSRLYVIDRDGKVAYKSGRGPHGFKPAEMEQSLLFLLAESENVKQQAAQDIP